MENLFSFENGSIFKLAAKLPDVLAKKAFETQI